MEMEHDSTESDHTDDMNNEPSTIADNNSADDAREQIPTDDAREQIPTDPNDRYFLTHCYVCQARAKPEQEFIRNYGGVVCFSCRAFWRRAHQKTRTPELRCKRNGNCTISLGTRSKCKKCRYEKCKITGMTQTAILTDDQKKIRFRKMNQKRIMAAMQMSSDQNSGQVESDNPNLNMADRIDISSQTGPQDFTESNFDAGIAEKWKSFNLFRSKSFISGPPRKSESILRKKVETIVTAYNAALEESEIPAQKELYNIIHEKMSEGSAASLNKDIVVSIIEKMMTEFRSFASKIRHFVELSEAEQIQLLRRNTPLYIQLQITSCLLTQEMSNVFEMMFDSDQIMPKLESMRSLLKPNSDLNYYNNLIRKLRSLWLLDQVDQQAILSFILLFETDSLVESPEDSSLDELGLTSLGLYNNHIESLDSELDYQTFVTTIVQMSIFCSENFSFDDFSSNKLQQRIVMPYTEAEESWLDHQYKLFDEAFFSVSLGEEIIQEFFMHSLGVPLSKSYCFRLFSAILERMHRIYKTQPDFLQLPNHVQNEMIQTNAKLGLSMIISRSESFSCGMDQIKAAYTDTDNAWWQKNFSAVFDKGEKIKHASVKSLHILDSEQLKEYMNNVSKVKSFVMDREMFKLKLILALTYPHTRCDSSGALSGLHSSYVTIFMRRMQWLNETKQGNFDPESKLSDFYNKLSILDKIAGTANFIMSQSPIARKEPTNTTSLII